MNPTVTQFRETVDQIQNIDYQTVFKTAFELCARIGEIISYKYPSDKTANPTGLQLSVSKTEYTPNLNSPKEFQTLMLSQLMQGKPTDITALSKIKESVAVFQVATEKRQGLIRQVGLPLDVKYDPWVQQIYDYFQQHKQSKALFPFCRQELWKAAQVAFKDFTYTIRPYKRAKIVDGIYIYKVGSDKLEKEPVNEHYKRFTNHAIRHLKASELTNYYGFDGADRSSYGGWTLASTEGSSASQERYLEQPWHTYFPKLLKQRI